MDGWRTAAIRNVALMKEHHTIINRQKISTIPFE